MFSKSSKIFLFLLLSAAFPLCINAQMCSNNQEEIQTARRNPQKEDVPQGLKENLAKVCIEARKKEYSEMLKRGEEALKLSDELEKAFASSNSLSADDRKKLERLEKIVKKIRSDLGGDDDGMQVETDENDSPLSMSKAFDVLKKNTVKLVEELKKTTRYSISAAAIQSSNLLLKVVKFLRFGK